MFNPGHTVVNAFIQRLDDEFRSLFLAPDLIQRQALREAADVALNTLLNCDCAYHDLDHTVLVTEAGMAILRGRQTARGDLSASDWLQAVVAMLFHDIGYLRQLLPEDTTELSVMDQSGKRVRPPAGATDAFMTPYHVSRGALYAARRFDEHEAIDAELVSECIEMTRFPVPENAAYQHTDTLPALVRAADLIGQMGDPQYLQKLNRLLSEFVETGQADRLGFSTPQELRASFPDFFYNQVHPFIGDAIAYLKLSPEGRQWIANLFAHLDANSANQDSSPSVRAPELVIDNSAL